MSKKLSSELKIAIFSGVFGILLTAIYDWIKEKPIATTFINLLSWIWNNILLFQIYTWQFVIGILIILFIKKIVKKVSKQKSIEEILPWLNYTQDTIANLKWKWYWDRDIFQKYNIENLRPLCPQCETSMHVSDSWSTSARCPRCNHYESNIKNLNDVKAVIIDNVQRNSF